MFLRPARNIYFSKISSFLIVLQFQINGFLCFAIVYSCKFCLVALFIKYLHFFHRIGA